MIHFLVLLIFFTFQIFSDGVQPENSILLLKEVKVKKILKSTKEYIEELEEISPNDKKIQSYVLLETDLYQIDFLLRKIYKNPENHSSKKFHKMIYFLMEKSLVSKNNRIGIRWGKVFRKIASESKIYPKGLYLMANLLYNQKKKESSLMVLDKALSLPCSIKLKEKMFSLKIAQLQDSYQIIKEGRKFLKEHGKMEHSDYILYKIILACYESGQNGKVEKYKKKFTANFSNSIHYNEIMKL